MIPTNSLAGLNFDVTKANGGGTFREAASRQRACIAGVNRCLDWIEWRGLKFQKGLAALYSEMVQPKRPFIIPQHILKTGLFIAFFPGSLKSGRVGEKFGGNGKISG